MSKTSLIKFWCWDWNIPWEIGQYYNCWCLGSLCHQGNSTNGIQYVEYTPHSPRKFTIMHTYHFNLQATALATHGYLACSLEIPKWCRDVKHQMSQMRLGHSQCTQLYTAINVHVVTWITIWGVCMPEHGYAIAHHRNLWDVIAYPCPKYTRLAHMSPAAANDNSESRSRLLWT